MPIRQADVISRLKAGETIIHVIENSESGCSYQYLSGGGASNSGHICQTHQLRKPISYAAQSRIIQRFRASRMGLG